MGRKLSEKDEMDICNRYKNGEAGTSISNDYPVQKQAIYGVLDRYNINRRNQSKAQRKYNLNHSSFKKLNNETVYWIGFLMADGSVQNSQSQNGQKILKLMLKESDKEHIEKFKNFLSTDYPIKIRPNNGSKSAQITIVSDEIVNDLSKYGVVPNKTFKAEAGKLSNNRHFWRGVVDGDGSLEEQQRTNYDKIRRVIRLGMGSQKIVEQFANFVRSFINTKAEVCYDGRYYVFRQSDSYAVKLAKKLYKNTDIYLDRKKRIAKSWYK